MDLDEIKPAVVENKAKKRGAVYDGGDDVHRSADYVPKVCSSMSS
jgi:hypothetical protein